MELEQQIQELNKKVEALKQDFNEFIDDLHGADISVERIRVRSKKKDATIYINPKKTKKMKFEDKDVVLVQKL